MIGFLCALPLLASLFSACEVPAPLAVGYVEGEYILLSPVGSAELIEVAVRKGDRVARGQAVARQDPADARIAMSEAQAQRLQMSADLEDLLQGSRPEEIAVIEASLVAAGAQVRQAERTAARQQKLVSEGYVSQSILDNVTTELQLAQTKVVELEAQLAVARLPARVSVIKAARSRVKAAEAALERARWVLEKRKIVAPVDGQIADVFRRVGEISDPTTPIVSILPDGGVKLVVYLPEPALSRLEIGDGLVVNCDGCTGLRATVSYISQEPEFTPPVIFSLSNRQKLVYLVEARPVPGKGMLKPGQIVDVTLLGPGQGQ